MATYQQLQPLKHMESKCPREFGLGVCLNPWCYWNGQITTQNRAQNRKRMMRPLTEYTWANLSFSQWGGVLQHVHDDGEELIHPFPHLQPAHLWYKYRKNRHTLHHFKWTNDTSCKIWELKWFFTLLWALHICFTNSLNARQFITKIWKQ